MPLEIRIFGRASEITGVKRIRIDIEGSLRLSELIEKSRCLKRIIEVLEEKQVAYYILVDGRNVSLLDENPIVTVESDIKIFTPTRGG